MTDTFDPQRFAAQLLTARQTHQPIAVGKLEDGPMSVDDAYAVQAIVIEEIGPVGGFKTGRKTPDATPIMAPIPASGIRPTPAHFTADELRLPAVELEIAFRLDADLPPLDRPDFAHAVRGCVSVLPVIEVVDCRLDDPATTDVFAKLADSQFNAGLVVGEARPVTDDMSFASAPVRFTAGDAVLGEGTHHVPGGDAFENFVAFCRLVGSHCGGLARGQIVTTGALTGMHFVEKGVTAKGSIEGLGDIRVEIAGP